MSQSTDEMESRSSSLWAQLDILFVSAIYLDFFKKYIFYLEIYFLKICIRIAVAAPPTWITIYHGTLPKSPFFDYKSHETWSRHDRDTHLMTCITLSYSLCVHEDGQKNINTI